MSETLSIIASTKKKLTYKDLNLLENAVITDIDINNNKAYLTIKGTDGIFHEIVFKLI